MAGRLHIAPFDLARLLPELTVDAPLMTSANMAPRRMLSAIRLEAGCLRLSRLFWGLTPPWLEVLDHAPHCARAESLESRPMFREAFQVRRCLVPASGVYVWKAQPRFKQPFLITRVDRGPLLLAGLWCRFHTSLAEHTDSLALITVPTNRLLAPLTDRLPAVIDPAQARRWLDPETPLEQSRALLISAPLELLGAFPVSRRVNNPAHQDAACAHPVGPMLRQPD
ncbi:MAG: SOS response-associated peptidase [Halomonas sp.]|nr:SOS response-associated peptidase [Halomonas sp.]